MKRYLLTAALCLSLCIPFTGCSGDKEEVWTDDDLGSIAEVEVPDETIIVDSNNFIEIVDDIYGNFEAYENNPIQITAQTTTKNNKQVVFYPCSYEESVYSEDEALYLQYMYDDAHANELIGEWVEIYGILKKQEAGGGTYSYYIDVETINKTYGEHLEQSTNETTESTSENSSEEPATESNTSEQNNQSSATPVEPSTEASSNNMNNEQPEQATEHVEENIESESTEIIEQDNNAAGVAADPGIKPEIMVEPPV